jgi:tetratricopeptide (TPR) repeat protein
MYEALGLWDLAAADRKEVVALTRGDPAWGSGDWYQHALLRLHVGDRDGYQDACHRLLKRYRDGSKSSDTITAVRAWALAPESPADPTDLVPLARLANISVKAGWRLYIEGLANYRAGQYQRAIECVDEALRLDPDWYAKAIVYPVQVMAYHRLGRVDEARRGLTAADKFMDGGADIRSRMPLGGMSKLSYETKAEAMDGWADSSSRMPLGGMPILWNDVVEFQLLHREATVLLTGSPPPDDPRLITARERALAALTDGGAAPFLDLGRSLAESGDWAAAAAEFARALDRSDDRSRDALNAYSSINQACSEVAQQPELFAALVRLRPADPHLWVARGRSRARKKQWAQALADYAKVMESRPPDDNAMLEYASLRLLNADAAGYKQLCGRLVEQFGDTTESVIGLNLSRVCTLAPGALADPERPIAWARLWTHNHAWSIHALGAAQYRAGRFDEAVRCFRESQRLKPGWVGQCMNDPFLALAHARLGQIDEARSWMDRTDRWLGDADHELAGERPGFPQSIYPADWLIVQVVRREAMRILAGAQGEPKAMEPGM